MINFRVSNKLRYIDIFLCHGDSSDIKKEAIIDYNIKNYFNSIFNRVSTD